MTDVVEEPNKDEVPETPVEQIEREARLDPDQALDWGDVQIAPVAEEPEAQAEEPAKEATEEVQTVAPVAPQTPLEDPGEYAPADYSFEIEVEGKKVTITTPEQAESVMDENADKFTAPELLKIIRQTSKMESKLESDKAEYDKKKTEFDEKTAENTAQQESINNIASEITYLVSKGKLPKVDPQYLNADWTDKEVAEQPGIKEQVALLNYMRDENAAREKAGLKPISSAIDAWNAWQLEEKNSDESEANKQAAAARKAAGARISGSSPNPVNIAPKGIAVGRAMDLADLESF